MSYREPAVCMADTPEPAPSIAWRIICALTWHRWERLVESPGAYPAYVDQCRHCQKMRAGKEVPGTSTDLHLSMKHESVQKLLARCS